MAAVGTVERSSGRPGGRLSRFATGGSVALGLLSAAAAVTLAIARATGREVDFDVYRMGGAHVLGGQLYIVRLPQLGMHFTYPPFAALLFWPFAQVSVHAGELVWSLASIALLAALTVVSIRAACPQWSGRRSWITASVVLFPFLWLSPAVLTLDFGQVNFMVAVLVLADLTCTTRLPRGLGVGVAAAIKLTPLIFIPFLLLTRQFRTAATAAGSFLVCSLAAFAIAPGSSRVYWSQYVFAAKRSGNLLYISDQNLHSAVQRMMGSAPSPVLSGVLTLLFAAGGLAVATWAYRTSSPMLGILLCAATGLIISPVSWSHHYVWVVPVLAWLALAADRPAGGRWWAVGVGALFWAAPIWWVPDVQQGYGGALVLLEGNSFFLAAVAFLLLAAALLWSRRRAAASEERDRWLSEEIIGRPTNVAGAPDTGG